MKAITLKLLIVAPLPPPWGGIGKWTFLLKKWLKEKPEVEFRIIDIKPWGRSAANRNILRRVIGGGIQGIIDLAKIIIEIIRFHPEVVHLTTSGSLAGIRDTVVTGICRVFHIPCIYHIRMGRMPEIKARNGWEWRTIRLPMTLSEKTILLDQASVKAVQPFLSKEKIEIIANTVELVPISEASIIGPMIKPVHRVLYLGWIIPAKGIRELINAWRAISTLGWELLLIGPSQDELIEELRGSSPLEQSIRFMGEVPNDEARAWILKSDIIVLPSHTEGFPNIILEAMAAVKPVIATPVGAIPEILDFNSAFPCGLEIPPHDERALASALRRLMDDENLRRLLGERGRRKVESRYGVPMVYEKLISVWYQAKTVTQKRKNDV